MPSEKSEIANFEGTEPARIGDILWYDGANWIRLPPGTDGQILTVVDLGGGDLVPQWQNVPTT
jgi:hypothetical protein